MRITRQAVLASRTCAICERTLLVGERSVRYSPDGESFLDVCPLCQEVALDYGWLKEGSPTTPVVDDRPAKQCPPLRTANSTPRCLTSSTAATTSAVARHPTTASGGPPRPMPGRMR